LSGFINEKKYFTLLPIYSLHVNILINNYSKTIEKNFNSDDISPVLDYLIEKAYSSDERFTESILIDI